MGVPTNTFYPKLSIITLYSPQKLAFAAQAGYEGVVVTPGPDFHPGLSDSAIDHILATARDVGIRIVCMRISAGRLRQLVQVGIFKLNFSSNSFISTFVPPLERGCSLVYANISKLA
ncbi:MAG: hypothetical protein WA869_15095 [Alloacidobacterium sp.]